MFRSPRSLTRSCPQRLLLLLGDPRIPAFSEHAGAARQGAGHVKGSGYAEIPGRGRSPAGLPLSTETGTRSTQLSLFCLDRNDHGLKEATFQNVSPKANLSASYQPLQISASESERRASGFWHCTLVENVGQKAKVGSTCFNCLNSTCPLQPWRRPWDIFQPLLSFVSKSRCNLLPNHFSCRWQSVRNLSWSTHAPWILRDFHHSPQFASFTPQQTRTIHQAAPRVVDAWRDCLSPKNENRCRLLLAPNFQLYEVKNVGKGASQSQGRNKSRWASILVSLCSVEGEPVFLFTLRSSTLKGRHKGDVCFAGGKSDPSDRDVVATALREAREELGITVAAERVWGILKPLRDVSGMMIAPVLANLGPLKELTFKPNPGEVEEIFTLSMSHLCNPHNRGYTHFRTGDKYGYTLPVFHNGKHRVWGLTAVALDHTLKLILTS